MCIHFSVEMTLNVWGLHENRLTLACMPGLCVSPFHCWQWRFFLQHHSCLLPSTIFPASQVPRDHISEGTQSSQAGSAPGTWRECPQGSAEGFAWRPQPRCLGTAVQMREVLCIWRMKLFGWSGGV